MHRIGIGILAVGVIATAQPLPEEIRIIAEQAYTFAYPLVVMEFTRRDAAENTPANFFAHMPQFPDDRFHGVIRPNADTLYSTAWLALSKEPVLLHVPDTQDGYFAANPIHRFAIGDRDPLRFNPDGSLDLFVQTDSPKSESNWLPAPAGKFSLMLRLYWPKEEILAGHWDPPAVVRH